MIIDSLRMDDTDVTPMAIAHNSLFTAKEKLELLTQLKSDAAAAGEEGHELGFDAEEIDRAIAEVHKSVQDGVGPQTVIKGDF
ncbi:hypothetical protein SAMN05428969_3374 [Devosia sp. YR412]|uniref:hypothetical protein n=1 Tax=Devosia sp. YR412 TaxID=1881030 RepID=UPI0008BA1CC1|nr:hypothetical protein [Devosia sp. YR412]SEQ52691.1 hypothetical protein SAMN05428969_3374 [Devosia sp. YR412]